MTRLDEIKAIPAEEQLKFRCQLQEILYPVLDEEPWRDEDIVTMFKNEIEIQRELSTKIDQLKAFIKRYLIKQDCHGEKPGCPDFAMTDAYAVCACCISVKAESLLEDNHE